jgi:hypothetical protein
MVARNGFGILLVGLALLGGCGKESAETAPAGVPLAPSTQTSLVDLIAVAPTGVPYEMTRRYEAYWGQGLQANSILYRERAFGDGAGNFAIEPVEVLEPSMSTNQENLFLLVQSARAGFFFRHRDFAIRDKNKFNRHWQLVDTGVTTQMLGRTCAQLQVQRQKNPERVYHLAVDVANGLVLRSEEKTLAGVTVALLEVESLNLTPSLGGVMFHQPVTQIFELGSSNPSQSRLAFIPAQPKLVPKGYHLTQSSAVIDPSTDEAWARYIYSDGLEEVFFLHGGKQEAVNTSGGLGSLSNAPPTGGAKAEDVVKTFEMGVWTVVWGEVKGERFLSMGKLPLDGLLDLVESAFY